MRWVSILFVLLYVSNSAFCIAIYLQPLVPTEEAELDGSSLTMDELLELRSNVNSELQRRALSAKRFVRVQRAMANEASSGANKRARIGGNIVLGRRRK